MGAGTTQGHPMNKILYIAIGAALAVAGYAAADYKRRANEEAQYAQTVRVTPVTETVKVPREECRNETTTRYVKRRDDTTATGTVVGALVGGLLGNQVGGGSGRKAATVAGAVAGGYTGHKIDQNNDRAQPVTTTQRRCRTVHDEKQEVVGYDVEYRYRDTLHTARMANDPGPRFRVREAVVIEPDAG